MQIFGWDIHTVDSSRRSIAEAKRGPPLRQVRVARKPFKPGANGGTTERRRYRFAGNSMYRCMRS